MTPKHYYEKDNYYFITTVTENRNLIFKDIISCDLLMNLITHYKFTCSYNIKAFIIMPDHLHLIIQPVGEENISDIMKKIKGSFSRYYNKLNKTTGTLFQKGFYDQLIKTEKQLHETINYIHYNPVKNGLVEEAKDYIYSSYNFYFQRDNRFQLIMMETFE